MIENKVKIPYEHTSLDDFIQHTINEANNKISKELALSANMQQVKPLHFISLTIDALQYYPGFAEIGQKFYQYAISKWKSVLDEAIKNREIRNDIDSEIISMNFLNISTGIIGNMIMRGSIDYAFEMFKKQMKELYKIIKL